MLKNKLGLRAAKPSASPQACTFPPSWLNRWPRTSPAQEKQRDKRRLQEAKSFGAFGEKWMKEARMADSTRAMRRAIFERDVLPTFKSRLLKEISPNDIRALCAKVKDRGAPATATHERELVEQRRLIDPTITHHGRLSFP